MENIYSPEVVMPEEIIGAIATKDVTFNTDVIGHRLARNLYRDEASGLRELAVNGITAIQAAIKAGDLSVEDSLLRITFKANGMLVIEDNGTGISMDAFENALSIMGNSTNFDGKLSGQMGMGFYAFMAISSVAFIQTMTRDGKSFSAFCRDAQEFKIYDKCQRKTPGTTITLQLYSGGLDDDDEELPKVDLYDLAVMAKDIGIGASVNVEVDISEIEEIRRHFDEACMSFGHEGIIKSISKENRTNMIYLEDEDFEVIATIHTHRECNASLFLAGVPIGSHEMGLPLIVNVKDERKYKPMPERERLTKQANEKMLQGVKDLLYRELKGLFGISDIVTYKASEMKHAFGWLIKVVDTDTINPMLTRQINDTGVNDKLFSAGSGKQSLLDIMDKYDNLVFCNPYDQQLYRLAAANGMVPILAVSKSASKVADLWGIPRIKPALKNAGVQFETNQKLLEGTVCHETGDKECGSHAKLSDVINTKKVIMFEKPCSGWLDRALEDHRSSNSYICWSKKLVGIGGITLYSEWISGVLNKTVSTNRGEMSFRDACKSGIRLKTHDLFDDSGIEMAKEYPHILIMEPIEEFDAYCASRELGMDGEYTKVTSKDMVFELFGIYVERPNLITPLLKVGLVKKMDDIQRNVLLKIGCLGGFTTGPMIRANPRTLARAILDSGYARHDNPEDMCMAMIRAVDSKISGKTNPFRYMAEVASVLKYENIALIEKRIFEEIMFPRIFGGDGVTTHVFMHKFEFRYSATKKFSLDMFMGPEQSMWKFDNIVIERTDGGLVVSGTIERW